MARTTRWASPAAAVSLPSPDTSTPSPPLVPRATATSYRDSARPRASKPGPRLALLAGARTTTGLSRHRDPLTLSPQVFAPSGPKNPTGHSPGPDAPGSLAGTGRRSRGMLLRPG